MNLAKASKIFGTAGVFALLVAMYLASAPAAAAQVCRCYSTSRVRHVSHRARRTARVRTVYRTRTVYVPTRVAGYSAYADDYGYRPASSVVVTEPTYASSVGFYDIESVARGWGHRDGFKDGWKAALKGRSYNVEHNGDFRDANNGYKRRFGSKFLYKSNYREGYAVGYSTGYRSVTREGRYGGIRY